MGPDLQEGRGLRGLRSIPSAALGAGEHRLQIQRAQVRLQRSRIGSAVVCFNISRLTIDVVLVISNSFVSPFGVPTGRIYEFFSIRLAASSRQRLSLYVSGSPLASPAGNRVSSQSQNAPARSPLPQPVRFFNPSALPASRPSTLTGLASHAAVARPAPRLQPRGSRSNNHPPVLDAPPCPPGFQAHPSMAASATR